MKLLSMVLLNKEARLFDTKEFLIKVFAAVLLAYVTSELVPYVSEDMISILFALIMTIEPVNLTGIRSGLKQVEATVIGAVITGLILSILGYSLWTAALTITATLYVSLLIDWRNFSVVAVFTSIYMNSFVQNDALGNPSQIETFKLRITALISGVLIAFFINWVFSVFGYRHMLEKRVYHILSDLSGKMNHIHRMLEKGQFEDATEIMRSFPGLFNNVDWIYGTAVDFEKDPLVKRSQKKQVKLEKLLKMTSLIREMTHVNYDICYRISKGDHHYQEKAYREEYNRIFHRTEILMDKLTMITRNKDVSSAVGFSENGSDESSLLEMNENIRHMDQLLTHY